MILIVILARLAQAIFSGQWFFLWLLIEIVYHLWATGAVINGTWRELMGHGHRKSHLYEILWSIHTGGNGNPFRTYGDEKRLKKTAGATNRATPEGLPVYWHPRGRTYRTIRNNLYVQAFLAWVFGMIAFTSDTVRAVTFALVALLAYGVCIKVIRLRKKHESENPFRQADKKDAEEVKAAVAQVAEPDKLPPAAAAMPVEKPKLNSGVPSSVVAGLLAREMGASHAEVEGLLHQSPTEGKLILPDTFSAVTKLREPVQDIIRAHTDGHIDFYWHTTVSPRYVRWIPVRTELPRMARFRDYVDKLEKLPRGDFGVGPTASGTLYVSSHRGDLPWHLRSCGPGTGKSTGFLVKAAQALHNDRRCEVYGIDTKQVSFEALAGVDRLHLYNDPEQHMDRIYYVWSELEGIMRDRYSALREHRARLEDFSDIWVFVDEANDLASQLKLYYINNIKERGDPVSPPLWAGPISALINLGRQVGIRGEFMFQNMTDKALGGVSLRDAFPVIGMAGFTGNQWSRIVGTTPVPELRIGPGRILMCKGPDQVWVQGLYDDEDWLRAYATAGR